MLTALCDVAPPQSGLFSAASLSEIGAEIGLWLFTAVYAMILVLICVYGIHRYALIYLFYRNKNKVPEPAGRFDRLPVVTVQLPVYNEQYVVRRLVERACAIDYPADRLEIQILDDSTDETQQICRDVAAEMRSRGHDVVYLHRDDRTGYKAGALEAGTKVARGEYLLIFDADFLPEPDILKRTVHYFVDPKVGMVQTRWEHINRNYSLLTKGQAIYLDGHFVVEHTARNRSGRFMNFNGTAGIWRKQAIEDAGGWQHDTLTEDLDLSFRSQLAGWKFVYLPDLTSPAELPVEMNSFKSQQHRWTKGGIQTAIKLLPRILRSDWPLKVRLEAFFHLTASSVYLYMFLLSIMVFPAFFIRKGFSSGDMAFVILDASMFLLASCAAASFFIVGQSQVQTGGLRQVLYLPFLMALGIGVAVVNTKAILEAVFGRQSEFRRTPKFGIVGRDASWRRRKYRGRRDWLPLVEILLGIYFTVMLVTALHVGHKMLVSLPFIVLFMSGYYYVGLMSLLQSRFGRRTPHEAPAASAPAPSGQPAA